MGDKCSVDLKVGRLNLKITIESISKLTSSTSVRIATSRSHKIMGMLEPFTHMQFNQAQVESWVACIEVPKEEAPLVIRLDLTIPLLIEKLQMLLTEYKDMKS